MFAVATGNRKTFEVGIFNKEVRVCVKENYSHEEFADEWADVRYQNVVAETKDEALAMIESRYPGKDGFVVNSIAEQRKESIFAV